MNLVSFPNAPTRAIIVEPFNTARSLWHARYAGDEWTKPIEFKPINKIGTLLPMLKEWSGRNGLPIVISDTLEKAA